ncbi:unnamed protein product [Knipowitschia caucasica]
MDNHVLFRRGRRISFSPDDVTTNKIAMIFQVRADTVYLIDDHNKVILPDQGGAFDNLELLGGGHYEVYGESTNDGGPGEGPPSTSNQQTPARFAFRRPFSASSTTSPAGFQASKAAGPKMLQRNVFIAELVDGRLETHKTVTLKFSEFESSLPTIKAKVFEALGQEQSIVLIDSHHNEIMDCEGTRGPGFWKQNARKIYAVPEEQLQRLRGNKRKRESRNGDSSALPEVLDQIEEVLLASQGLQEVSKSLKDLVAFVRGNKYTTVSLSEDQAAAVKAAFSCVICRDPMKDPMFASCCTTVLGCRACLDQWQDGHAHCPKCRTDDFSFHIQSVVGLDDALTALHNIIS